MTDANLLQQQPQAETAARPAALPEKFWDSAKGAVRVEALLNSYLALEKKLSNMLPDPRSDQDRARLHRALGVPASPEEYCIDCKHGLFTPDAGINARLHAAGFTPEQAQTVYDLAAEKLVPLILDIAAQFEAEREIERLEKQFGGAERWQETARQLAAFGRRALPPEALNGLSSSYEGVMALHRMMQDGLGREAGFANADGTPEAFGEKDLQKMMRDPKYWRDRDPKFVEKVTAGFRALYGQGG